MRCTVLAPRRGAAGLAVAALFLTLLAPLAGAQDTPDSALPSDAAPAPDAAQAPDAAPAETTPTVPVHEEAPAAAPAQADAKDATQLETIEVTGSRLKRSDYESAQPVVSISREDIERTGLTDISQILRHLTVAGNNSATPQQGRFALSLGEVNLDLRNLGAQHTLLLVNGRRWVTGLISTQPSVSDYNTIPTSIIERVEILKDGASAIYGSDAIGGVVNIITRKDYQGGGLSYHLGQFAKYWDGTNRQADLSFGDMKPDSSFFVNLSHTEQDRASNEARPLTASPANGIARQSAVTTRGTFILLETSGNAISNYYGCPAAIGDTEQLPNPGPGPTQVGAGVTQCTLQRNVNADPTSSTQSDYHQGARTDPNVSPDDVFNRFGEGSLTEPNTRTALYTQFSHDIANGMNFSVDMLYNVRRSTSVGQRGYMGGGDRLIPGSPSYLAYIPVSNPDNPFGQDIGKDSTCARQDDPTCQHLGAGTGLWAMRLGGDKDNNNTHDDVKTARIGTNLKGDFDAFSMPVSWDLGYIFARNKIQELFPNARFDYEAIALQNGVDQLNGDPQPPCTAPCSPLDVFHGRQGVTSAAVNYVFYDAWQRNQNRQDIWFVDFSSELPIASFLPGPIAMATGIEMRRDQYVSHADPVIQQGLVFFNRLTDTQGKTFSREAYVEFGIPLLQDLPFARTIELDVAGRYSQYPTFGNVTTGKGGLRWKPFDDLLVRGTYSTGFRAPNVGELYNGPSQSYDGVADPCVNSEPANSTTNQNCALDGVPAGGPNAVGVIQPYDLWRGNPNLRPEKSKNLTYGLVYSPHFIPDLNLALDFYDIKVDDFIAIGGVVGQHFIDNCERTARTSPTPNSGPDCEKVHRDAGGNLLSIDVPWFNLAGIHTAGVDAGIDYILPLPARLGQFKFSLEGSYLTTYDQTIPGVKGAPDPIDSEDHVDSLVGRDEGQFSGYPRVKAGGVLAWKQDVWNVSWTTRMAYHMREPCSDIFDALDQVSKHVPDVCSDPKPAVDDDPATVDDPNTRKIENNETYVPYNDMRTVFYHNVQVGRELPGVNANFTLGVQNVLNQDPPLSRSNIGIFWYNYDPNHYEPPGRIVYLQVGMKF